MFWCTRAIWWKQTLSEEPFKWFSWQWAELWWCWDGGITYPSSPDGMSIENMTIKRNSKAKAFQDLLPPTTIGEKKVFISTIFFSCLTALSNFPDDVEQNFSFKLRTKPTTLFKQEMMRKPTRANLQNHFIENEIPVNLVVRDDHRKRNSCKLRRTRWLYYWWKLTCCEDEKVSIRFLL